MFDIVTTHQLTLYLGGVAQGVLIGWLLFKPRRSKISVSQKSKSGNCDLSGSIIGNNVTINGSKKED